MQHLSETQLQILEALARYRYLTAAQMATLGIAQRIETIHRAVRGMQRNRGQLIERKDFAVLPGVGRVAGLHYLKEAGKRFLIEHLDKDPQSIRYPKGTSTLFQRKYFHSVGLVDFHIAWDQFAAAQEFTEIQYINDFDFIGANRGGSIPRTAKAKIPITGHKTDSIIPDTVIHYREPSGRERLFLYELTNGKDSKRVMPQIYGHAHAISQNAAQSTFRAEVSGRVLLSFQYESTMKSVARRFTEDGNLTPLREWFLFGVQERVIRSMNKEWLDTSMRRYELWNIK